MKNPITVSLTGSFTHVESVAVKVIKANLKAAMKTIGHQTFFAWSLDKLESKKRLVMEVVFTWVVFIASRDINTKKSEPL
mmetsp:Transcript_31208/g.63886  ORF Transcript_31208/g.63886 Transcript_31208/m.63886 type:complete len:80 (+) Transcript_31208:174-413(+)